MRVEIFIKMTAEEKNRSQIINKVPSAHAKKHFLFLQVMLVAIVIPFLINLLRPLQLLHLLNKPRRKELNEKKIKNIISYVHSLMAIYPWQRLRNKCFVHSAILFYFLRREGLEIKINFGINKTTGLLTGHSWLTLKDKIYLENQERIRDFGIIYTFPQ